MPNKITIAKVKLILDKHDCKLDDIQQFNLEEKIHTFKRELAANDLSEDDIPYDAGNDMIANAYLTDGVDFNIQQLIDTIKKYKAISEICVQIADKLGQQDSLYKPQGNQILQISQFSIEKPQYTREELISGFMYINETKQYDMDIDDAISEVRARNNAPKRKPSF